MPEYHNAKSEESAKLESEAAEFFQQGAKARRISDAYVRATVLLATVLLLTRSASDFEPSQCGSALPFWRRCWSAFRCGVSSCWRALDAVRHLAASTAFAVVVQSRQSPPVAGDSSPTAPIVVNWTEQTLA
jgi:hypothetical protein